MVFVSKLRVEQASSEPAYNETIALASSLSPFEGVNSTLVEDVTVLRVSQPVPRVPVLYEPCIVFVVQGTKRGFVGSQRFVYDAKTVLVMSAPIPFECITETSNNGPLIAVYLRIRREIVADLMASIEQTSFLSKPPLHAIESTELDRELADALTRLLRSLRSPDDARVLGKQLIREITYRVLMGKNGNSLRATVNCGGHFSQLCHALQRIHNEYHQPLEVADLARESGMSASIFHLHFKKMTSTSPVQYIKAVRLHNARSLMLRSHLSAGAAAAKVGYKSASQFGREFKRFFGSSPVEEIEKLGAGRDPCLLATKAR